MTIQGPFGLVVSHSMLIVLLLGLVGSGLASSLAYRIIQHDEEQRFEMARREVSDLVRSRFDRFLGVLLHTRAFLTTKERVSRQDFKLFLQSVDLPGTYPDLLGVGYADRIAAAHSKAHERDVREDGYRRYRIWPKVKGAAHFYPVKYIEPFNSFNQRALGFDLHSEERRALAMDQARESGIPELSGTVTLAQDGDTPTPGFLLFLPVFGRERRADTAQERRWALQGFVYAPFRGADFFRELTRSSAIFHKGIGLRAVSAKEDLFSTGGETHRSLRVLDPVSLYGQTWNLEIFATPAFASPADRAAPLFVFIAGLLITFLASGVVYMTGRHSESQREAIEMRDEFLSICSHELRTPLTSMKLQNQLVQRTLHADLASGNTARFEKMVLQSGRQIDRLVRLVEEMLDISRIRSGKLSLVTEELDFSQLVQDTVERFGPQLQAAGCAIQVKAPPEFVGFWDRMRLEQILVNLLSNAIKYGAGKPIQVELSQAGETAVLSVQDEGRGIAPEHQSLIFERFERAAAVSEISGLGLGLYIVKKILELQGGTIRVESQLGKGSRFVVEIPVDVSNAAIASEDATPGDSPASSSKPPGPPEAEMS